MNTSPSQTRSLLIQAFKQASQFQMETTCTNACSLELKELSFFLNFIILHALFNAPTCVDSESLCMGTPALLKKLLFKLKSISTQLHFS